MERPPNSIRPGRPEAPAIEGRTGSDGLLEDLVSARRELLAARHDTYHRLLGILIALISGPEADPTVSSSFERVWRTRSFPTFYERPLLILAALRADALEEGSTHPLHGALAEATPDANVVTTESVATALGRERLGVWAAMTTRRVQTNDTSRAVAWLWPAFLAGCDDGRRPLALVDIGAGAGLNLIADQLPVIWSDLGSNKEIPCALRVKTVARVGFDTRPLNVESNDDVLWMRACIWVGDTARLGRFEAGVQALRAPSTRPTRPVLERLTASLVPGRLTPLLAPLPVDTLLIAYQTLVAGYLEVTERENYRKGMMDFILRESAGRAVWLELELDDARRHLPALLTAHVRAGQRVKSLRLGRMSQHPTEIDVHAAGVAELCRHLGVREK